MVYLVCYCDNQPPSWQVEGASILTSTGKQNFDQLPQAFPGRKAFRGTPGPNPGLSGLHMEPIREKVLFERGISFGLVKLNGLFGSFTLPISVGEVTARAGPSGMDDRWIECYRP